MRDLVLRKCGAGTTAGEERVVDVVVCTAMSAAGCKANRILQETEGGGGEEEEATSTGPGEQGFRICHKRARTSCTVMHRRPPHAASSSSSGNLAPAGSVLDCDAVDSSLCCAGSSDSSSSSAKDEAEPEPQDDGARDTDNRLRVLQEDMVAVIAQGDNKERIRATHRTSLTGKHSTLDSSSTAPCATPAASSSSSGLEVEEEPSAASKPGELESKAANTVPAAPGSTGPEAAAVAHPDVDEIEAFFAKAEEDLRRGFTNKYNYDIAKDTPLEGRFEWVPIKP